MMHLTINIFNHSRKVPPPPFEQAGHNHHNNHTSNHGGHRQDHHPNAHSSPLIGESGSWHLNTNYSVARGRHGDPRRTTLLSVQFSLDTSGGFPHPRRHCQRCSTITTRVATVKHQCQWPRGCRLSREVSRQIWTPRSSVRRGSP